MSPNKTFTQKSNQVIWTQIHTKHFKVIKDKIAQSTENFNYNPELDITVKCDAPRSELGAALEQNTSDGRKPIAFASRFLNTTE